jgi:hypothetical protein
MGEPKARGKCPFCGDKLDFRVGVTMRGPLDPTMICTPCALKPPQVDMFKEAKR